MTAREWLPIETAPKDGGPVWARGWNYGKETDARHFCWAYWDDDQWNSDGPEPSTLLYLTDWMPLTPEATP